jgi:endonuclease/exonuclease/phosphatase family metal-dependent hydrolase
MNNNIRISFYKNILCSCALLFCTNVGAQDTITVMQYNLLNFSTSSQSRADDYLKDILKFAQADILLVNELTSTTAANYIKTNALNVDGVNYYDNAAYNNGPSFDNMVYYNTSKFTLVSQLSLSTSPRYTDGYRFYYNDPNLSYHNDTVFFNFYVTHLKASTGYESTRAAAANTIRNHLDGLSDVNNTFLVGDFNIYNSSEPAYFNFLDNGACQLFDPINRPGTWHNNSDFSDIHTQSTRTTSFGGGAIGGLDDRFDFILTTSDILSGGNRVQYIENSYRSLGNDGHHFNKALTATPLNTLYPDSVVQDLYNMSDHLPVQAKFVIDLPEGPPTGVGPCTDIFISEYQEGSETGVEVNRSLELFNPTNQTIFLTDYEIRFYPNGTSSLISSRTLNPVGSISPGQTFVIASSKASNSLSALANFSSGLLDTLMDGNDAVVLVNTNSGDTLDVIGDIGADPGTEGWQVDSASTKNHTLVRKDYIKEGSTSLWSYSSSEWLVFEEDHFDSLTKHSYYSCEIAETICGELFISEYIRGSGGNTAIEIYNPTNQPVLLNDYSLRLYTNGASTSFYESMLDGVIYPQETFIISSFTSSLSGIINYTNQVDSFPGALFFTGDDALALFKDLDTIDVIGVIGEDPGNSWAVYGTNAVNGATRGYTLVRDSSIQEGQTNWTISSQNEWEVYVQDLDSKLSTHYAILCDTVAQERKKIIKQSTSSKDKYELKTYPNPVISNLTIETIEESNFEITTLSGTLIKEGRLKAGINQIELDNLKKGLYLVKVKSDRVQQVLKIIVE